MNTAAHANQQRLTRRRLELRPTIKVGDSVRLNDHGLEQCFGHSLGLSKLKETVHKITHVDRESMTYPEATFPVGIDDPELNQFLLDDACFEVVNHGIF